MLPTVATAPKVTSRLLNKVFYLTGGPRSFLCMITRAHTPLDGFCRALKECWRRIPSSLIQTLVVLMPRRLTACRAARGY
ncbi:hypothetical protein GGP41_007568 [Bipolaris sorokiniana]|uniref:Uncharacterized protein n=1 Tax=Cochliobolus sativus TaxID=45130 RepID=A0A8H6DSE1_COCSA|nr:hypothetical protein GGP41_007568 [Bipolaris sorokiniana]